MLVKVSSDFWETADPEFELKTLGIGVLYVNPPANTIDLFDGETFIQNLDRTRPRPLLWKSNTKMLTATGKRNLIVNWIASLASHKEELLEEAI